jgi:hypothetical protein
LKKSMLQAIARGYISRENALDLCSRFQRGVRYAHHHASYRQSTRRTRH